MNQVTQIQDYTIPGVIVRSIPGVIGVALATIGILSLLYQGPLSSGISWGFVGVGGSIALLDILLVTYYLCKKRTPVPDPQEEPSIEENNSHFVQTQEGSEEEHFQEESPPETAPLKVDPTPTEENNAQDIHTPSELKEPILEDPPSETDPNEGPLNEEISHREIASLGDFEQIPNEIILHMASFLPNKDMMNCSKLNHKWKALLKSNVEEYQRSVEESQLESFKIKYHLHLEKEEDHYAFNESKKQIDFVIKTASFLQNLLLMSKKFKLINVDDLKKEIMGKILLLYDGLNRGYYTSENNDNGISDYYLLSVNILDLINNFKPNEFIEYRKSDLLKFLMEISLAIQKQNDNKIYLFKDNIYCFPEFIRILFKMNEKKKMKLIINIFDEYVVDIKLKSEKFDILYSFVIKSSNSLIELSEIMWLNGKKDQSLKYYESAKKYIDKMEVPDLTTIVIDTMNDNGYEKQKYLLIMIKMANLENLIGNQKRAQEIYEDMHAKFLTLSELESKRLVFRPKNNEWYDIIQCRGIRRDPFFFQNKVVITALDSLHKTIY